MRFAFLLVAVALAALAARSIGFFEEVLKSDVVVLQGQDPWIHFREVQALTRDLHQDLSHDPYLIFPERTAIPVAPLLDTSAAIIVRTIFGSEATDRQIGIVCAWIPPIVGAATVLVVFFLGRKLGGQAAGFTAAGVLALGPSLFFYNSRLGMTDHHVLEAFFTALYALALLCAIRHTSPPTPYAIAPAAPRFGKEHRLLLAIAWSLASGVVLVLYLWTWVGGAYWIAIITCFAAAQFCIRHLRGESTAQLTLALLPGMLLAATLLAAVPLGYPLRGLQLSATWSAAAFIAVMQALSSGLSRRCAHRAWFPAALLALGGVGVVTSFVADAELFDQAKWFASLLTPNRQGRTIEEVLPIFLQDGSFSLGPLWSIFGTTLPVALLGLVAVIRRLNQTRNAGLAFLLVWTMVTFTSMAGQRRFAYYASVCIALLAGLAVQELLSWGGDRRHGDRPHASRSALGERASCPSLRSKRKTSTGWVRPFAATSLLCLLFIPGLASLPQRATDFDGPSRGWLEALNWMREQTPEPFGDSSYYDQPGAALSPDALGAKPYGVMSSWDCGYWITAIARRIPCSNPTQMGAAREGRFFTSRSESEAGDLLSDAGARYVVLDSAMVAEPLSLQPDLSSKLYSMAAWADRRLDEYYERFELEESDGATRSVYLFHPAYFESMAVRLYAFGGTVVEPSRMLVVRYEEILRGGETVKRIVESAPLSSYDDAVKRAGNQTKGKSILVSDNPFQSCVPLDAMSAVRLVYDSRWTVRFPDASIRPEVRVFEFLVK